MKTGGSKRGCILLMTVTIFSDYLSGRQVSVVEAGDKPSRSARLLPGDEPDASAKDGALSQVLGEDGSMKCLEYAGTKGRNVLFQAAKHQ